MQERDNTTMVKIILLLENLLIFFGALYFYHQIDGNWLHFLLLLFVPDISMIGYLKNPVQGSLLYNLVHNYILAIFLMLLGIATNNTFFYNLGIILSAHVALDRTLGYGLKYPTKFKDTHIQKV